MNSRKVLKITGDDLVYIQVYGKNAARRRLGRLCLATLEDTNREFDRGLGSFLDAEGDSFDFEGMANGGTWFRDTNGRSLFDLEIETEYNPEVVGRIQNAEAEGDQLMVYVVCVRTLDKESPGPWKDRTLSYRTSGDLLTWPYGEGKDGVTTCLSFKSVQEFLTSCMLCEEPGCEDNDRLEVKDTGDQRDIFRVKDSDQVLRFYTIGKVSATSQ
jgi:hypothetical protein